MHDGATASEIKALEMIFTYDRNSDSVQQTGAKSSNTSGWSRNKRRKSNGSGSMPPKPSGYEKKSKQ